MKLDSNGARLARVHHRRFEKGNRIRNNPRVNVAPCDMRGGLQGEWVPTRAEIPSGRTRHAVAKEENMGSANNSWISLRCLVDYRRAAHLFPGRSHAAPGSMTPRTRDPNTYAILELSSK